MSPRQRQRFDHIVHDLLEWYAVHQREFVWRKTGHSPYVVLVSEFMLQQTGAAQVEKMLPLFLKQFPTVQKLARATNAEVLRAWQGLGYNRRALNLHATAKVIATEYRKSFPRTMAALTGLPGVGHYTASAVLAFAFEEDVPVVDVNIQRVLSRLDRRMPDFSTTLAFQDILSLDEEIYPRGHSSEWHQALMDIGSRICIRRNPKCEECPLRDDCPSAKYFLQIERSAPIVPAKPKETLIFGEPKRIWRGRVLKQIANASKISKRDIIQNLKSDFGNQGKGFAPFVEELLSLLTKEGFSKKSGDYYSLA